MQTFLFILILSAWGQITKNIPPAIAPLLETQAHLIATVQEKEGTYYFLEEIYQPENKQVLIVVSKNSTPKVLARDRYLFPLQKYKLTDTVIKDIARQYTEDMIQTQDGGIKALQEMIDYNPAVFVPTAPELIEAYQNAGLKLPPARKP
ncbi:MAG: hypothetical protein ACOY3I_07250 [Verrucomicrobiota bacterium]